MVCFDRDRESRTLWRHFEMGRNVLMLAPRRTGKTVLLDRLKKESGDHGFCGIVLDVEGFSEEKEFFRQLCSAIQEEAGPGRSLLSSLTGRLKQLVRGAELTPGDDWRNLLLQVEWSVFAEHLLAELEKSEDKRWLFLVDEITIFVQTILNRHGKERASDFLYALRRLARSFPKVNWLFTGSIGLDTVARHHGFEGALVDLELVQLGPFDRTTAEDFIRAMALQNKCAFNDESIRVLLDRLGWLSPYYLLKYVEAACEKSDHDGSVRTEHVEAAAEALLEVSRRLYWATWREHLDKNFLEPKRDRLFRILEILCRSPEGANLATIQLRLNPGGGETLNEREIRDLLDSLEADGYLIADEDRYRFRFQMNLLREWWFRYVASSTGKEGAPHG